MAFNRHQLLTPLAAECAERLADMSELEDAVGSDHAQRVKETVRSVYNALGGHSDAFLASAVGDLVCECASLPEFVADQRPGAGDDDFSDCLWSFGPAVAEIILLGVVAVAGLGEVGLLPEGGTVRAKEIYRVLEMLGKELDWLAPYIFSGLCLTDGLSARGAVGDGSKVAMVRLKLALQGICAWSLMAVGHAMSFDKLTASTIWEWGSGDILWVLALAKGVLTVIEPQAESSAFSKVPTVLLSPAETAQLKAVVVAAVLGLPSPEIAFAGEYSGRDIGSGGCTIAERSLVLATHRARLAAAAAQSDLIGSLLPVLRAMDSARRAQFVAFLVALLQPELSLCPEWPLAAAGGAAALQFARNASFDLRSSIGWHAETIWTVLASVAVAGHLPFGFLKDCCSLGFSSPVPEHECAQLIRACLKAGTSVDVTVQLCILAANAGLEPNAQDQIGLMSALVCLPQAQMSYVVAQLQSFVGPVKRDSLEVWLSAIESQHQSGLGTSNDNIERSPLLASVDADFAECLPPDVQGRGQRDQCGASSTGSITLRELLEQAPPEVCCALDGRLLVDAVRAPSGHVYERAVLRETLAKNGGKCPAIGTPLALGDCHRDPDSRRAALHWLREHHALRSSCPLSMSLHADSSHR